MGRKRVPAGSGKSLSPVERLGQIDDRLDELTAAWMGGVPFGDARGQAEVYDEIRVLEVEREKITAAGTPDPKKTPLTAQQRARLNVLAAQRKDLDYAYIATDDPVERARIRRETDAVNRAMARVGYDIE